MSWERGSGSSISRLPWLVFASLVKEVLRRSACIGPRLASGVLVGFLFPSVEGLFFETIWLI